MFRKCKLTSHDNPRKVIKLRVENPLTISKNRKKWNFLDFLRQVTQKLLGN